MARLFLTVLGIFCLFFSMQLKAEDEVAETPNKIVKITVYRGQALVTREITLPKEKGQLNILVKNLPHAIQSNSLLAESADDSKVQLRGVRYHVSVVETKKAANTDEVDKKIRTAQRNIFSSQSEINVLTRKEKYLDQLERFTTTISSNEKKKEHIDIKTLRETSMHVFEQRSLINKQKITLQFAIEDAQLEINKLNKKRSELTRSSRETRRQAAIIVDKQTEGVAKIYLKYIVNNCNWSPSYNVNLSKDGRKMTMEYQADINQLSGEDWTDVELTLSTAVPHLAAQSPLLSPLWVNLAAPVTGNTARGSQTLSSHKYVQQLEFNLKSQNDLEDNYKHSKQMAWARNGNSFTRQHLELQSKITAIREGNKFMRRFEEAISISYHLEGHRNLRSRSDSQLTRIKKTVSDCESFYECTPLLNQYIYRYAKTKNDRGQLLLKGPYTAYVGGDFVGKGQMQNVIQGQSFVLGFGVDNQLKCRRELVNKSDDTSWGNRIQIFEYQLRIDNFKDQDVDIRLYDRLPNSKSEELEITLLSNSLPLSKDALYVRDFKDKGVLRWDLTLKANSHDLTTKTIDYKYKMKFDKTMSVNTVNSKSEKARAAFFKQQRK
jgi:hypothetical protein